MDLNPMESVETAQEQSAIANDRRIARLNTWVALTIAILATFMGVCKVKDDNIVQAMQQAQADKIDHWGYYQARNLREELAKATLVQLTLSAKDRPTTQQTEYTAAIASYAALEKEQAIKKQAVMAQAKDDQKTYDALNIHDDQFDLSDALLAISISLLALTALTHKQWLFWVALLPMSGGVLMGLAGLLGWALHPDALSRLLS
jgi:hypothetical protein